MLGRTERQVNQPTRTHANRRDFRMTASTCTICMNAVVPVQNYCSLAYSALACFKMGMSGSLSERQHQSRKLQIKSINFLAADVAQHQRRIIWT